MSEVENKKWKKHRKASRKKKVLFTVLACVLVVVLGVVLVFSLGAAGGAEPVMPDDTKTICLTPPDDGSSPEDWSALENIGYIVGRLAARPYYHTDSAAHVVAKSVISVEQDIYATKDYKDGITLTSQLSISGNETFAPSKALQKFFGEDRVVVRNAASRNAADWDGKNTVWDDGEPSEVYTYESYLNTYGLPATEFSDFIINGVTILDLPVFSAASEALSLADTQEEEGFRSVFTYDEETELYTISVSLDPLTSVVYYVNNMMKMGNLKKPPEFTGVGLTFRFREDWTIVSMDIAEDYKAFVSVLTTPTSGRTTVEFSYDEADVDVSDYEEYFIEYANAAPVGGDDAAMSAQDYFLEGFSSVLNGRSVFAVRATVAGQPIEADILLDMSMQEQAFSINALQVQLGDLAAAYGEGSLYVQYKDFVGRMAASDLLSLFGGLFGGGESGFDPMSLLGGLLGSAPVVEEDFVTIEGALDLGGLHIPVSFGFDLVPQAGGGEKAEWSYIEASLQAAGVEVELRVTPGEQDTVFAAVEEEKAVDLMPYAEEILALVQGKAYALTLGYTGEEGSKLAARAQLRIHAAEGLALTGKVNVTYGTLNLPLSVTLAGDTVYLSLYNIKLSATFAELESAVEKLLPLAGVQLPAAAEADIAELVSKLLSADFERLIEGLTLTENKLSLTVNADALLSSLLGEAVSLGKIEAAYERGAGFAASVEKYGVTLGFGADAQQGAIAAPADAAAYVPLSAVLAFADPVAAVIQAQSARLSLAADVTAGGVTLYVSAEGEFSFADGMQLYLTLRAGGYTAEGKPSGGIALRLAYANDALYVLYGDAAAYVTVEELTRLVALAGGEEAGAADAVADLFGSIDWNALLGALALFAEQDDALRVSLALSEVLGETFGDLTLTASVQGDGVRIAAERAELAGVVLSNVSLALGAGDGSAAFPLEGAVSAASLIEEIETLILSKAYALTLGYTGEEGSKLAAQAQLRIHAAEGLALTGKVNVTYGTLNLPLSVTLAGDTVYLSLYNIKLSATFAELESAVEKLLPLAGVQLPAAAEADIAELVSKLLSADFERLIEGLTLTENKLSLTVNADALLSSLLGEAVSLGKIEAAYERGAGFAASVEKYGVTLGFGADAQQGAIAAPADAAEYVPLSAVLAYADAVAAIAKANVLEFSLSDLAVVIDGQTLVFGVEGEVWLKDALQLRLSFEAGEERIDVSYLGGELRIGYGGYMMRFTKQEIEEIAASVSAFLESSGVFGADLASLMQLFGEDGIDFASLLESLELAVEEGGGLVIAADLAALLQGEKTPVSLVVGTNGKNELSLRLKENTVLQAFGLRIASFTAKVGAPDAPKQPAPVTGTLCGNIFEFILRSYNTLADTDTLSLSLQYAAESMAVDLHAAVQLRANDTAEESNVVVNLSLEGVISTEGGSYYVQAAVVEENVYLYFSLVGFKQSTLYPESVAENAVPLRARFAVSSLFDMASDAMPLIMSLMGLDKNELYYFNFVVEILAGSYKTINSDIFNEKSTQEWVDLILGIVGEYAGGAAAKEAPEPAAPEAPAAESEGIEVSFNFADRTVVLSGAGLDATLAAGGSAPAAPADAAEYTDFSPLAVLVGVMMDSITTEHPVYGEDGQPALDGEGNAIQTADINSYYYLTGNATIHVPIVGDIAIGIYASVYIHKDFSVTVNLYLDIPGSVGTNESDVYVTIEGGMVYLCSVTGGTRSYRVTTLDNFFGDFLKHLTFLFNFKDLVAGLIPTDPSGGSAAVTDIGSILTSFNYNGAASEGWAQQWKIGVNVGSFTDSVIGDATLTLGADANGTLKGLEFNTSVYGILDLTASLDYKNPGTAMGDKASNGDVTQNIAQETKELFGKGIGETDWEKTSYLAGTPVTLRYTLNGTQLASQQVVYDSATGKLLTDLDLPDLSGYDAGEGAVYGWYGEPANGSTEFAARNMFVVTLYSEYAIEGMEPVGTEGGLYVYEAEYPIGEANTLPFGVESADPGGFAIAGFTDRNGNAVSSMEELPEDRVLSVLWEVREYTVVYTVFGEEICTQTYRYGDALVLPADAAAEGYTFVGWGARTDTVTEDLRLAAQFSVTVTLGSDFKPQIGGIGFAGDAENGYFRTYTLVGAEEKDFDLTLSVTAAGYAQFGWWRQSGGTWQNVSGLAGLDGQTVWAAWVTDVKVTQFSASKTFGLVGYQYKYSAVYTGAVPAGQRSEAILAIESASVQIKTVNLSSADMNDGADAETVTDTTVRTDDLRNGASFEGSKFASLASKSHAGITVSVTLSYGGYSAVFTATNTAAFS